MTYVTVSFSGGKDSTAMLLRMMEIGEHIDEVITCDTGMEFPEMYEHLDRVRGIVEANGIRYTVLKADHPFEWFLLEKEVHSKTYPLTYGFGWPGPYNRWCTKHLKTKLIQRRIREIRAEHGDFVQCIGLAADETARLERKNNTDPNHRHPLVEWGWTERDALQYCYSHGYDWGGLYDIYKRVSCWCCPLSSIPELRKLRHHHPDLWARLFEMDAALHDQTLHHCERSFNPRYTLDDLEARFAREDLAKREQTSLDDYIPVIPT